MFLPLQERKGCYILIQEWGKNKQKEAKLLDLKLKNQDMGIPYEKLYFTELPEVSEDFWYSYGQSYVFCITRRT